MENLAYAILKKKLIGPLAILIIHYADHKIVKFKKQIKCNNTDNCYITDNELYYYNKNLLIAYNYKNDRVSEKYDFCSIIPKHLCNLVDKYNTQILYVDLQYIICCKSTYKYVLYIIIDKITSVTRILKKSSHDYNIADSVGIHNDNIYIIAPIDDTITYIIYDNKKKSIIQDNFDLIFDEYDLYISYNYITTAHNFIIYVAFYKIIDANHRCNLLQIVKYSVSDKKIISNKNLKMPNNIFICSTFKWHTFINDELYLMGYKKGSIMRKEKLIMDSHKVIIKINMNIPKVINYYHVCDSINNLTPFLKFNCSENFIFKDTKQNVIAMDFDIN
jgi:hypothetical protein